MVSTSARGCAHLRKFERKKGRHQFRREGEERTWKEDNDNLPGNNEINEYW
jgi:hypothetical protein